MKELLSEEDKNLIDRERVPTTYRSADNYEILIFKSIYFSQNDIKDETHRYIVTDDKICNASTDICFQKKEGTKDILKAVKGNIQRIDRTLILLEDELDELEQQLSIRSFKITFMDTWFHTRDSLVSLDKSVNRLSRTLSLAYSNSKFLFKTEKELVKNVLLNLDVLEKNISTYNYRLDALHNYYSSMKNDRINSNLYVLSIISAVFLPLNLIVGFFGMNTKSLYLENHPQGTQMVVWLLGGTFISILIFPRLFGWLQKYVLNKFFGRYNFYKRINPSSKKD